MLPSETMADGPSLAADRDYDQKNNKKKTQKTPQKEVFLFIQRSKQMVC
jgi:hypothetical protein